MEASQTSSGTVVHPCAVSMMAQLLSILRRPVRADHVFFMLVCFTVSTSSLFFEISSFSDAFND